MVLQWTEEKGYISRNNLTVSNQSFNIQNMHTKARAAIATSVDRIALTPKTIRYAPSELRQIQHDYKVLPIEAIKTIKKFRLNCKRRRHLYTVQKRELNRNKHRQTK